MVYEEPIDPAHVDDFLTLQVVESECGEYLIREKDTSEDSWPPTTSTIAIINLGNGHVIQTIEYPEPRSFIPMAVSKGEDRCTFGLVVEHRWQDTLLVMDVYSLTPYARLSG